MPPKPASAVMPSWMRAPPPSLIPTTGAPVASARSISVWILRGEHFTERATEDPEVVSVDEDLAAVHGSPTRHHAVGVGAVAFQTEPCRTVTGEQADLRRTTPRRAARRSRSRAVILPRARCRCVAWSPPDSPVPCAPAARRWRRAATSAGAGRPLGLGRCARGLDVASSGEVSSRRRARGQPPVGDCSSSVHYVCSMSAVSGQFGPPTVCRHE